MPWINFLKILPYCELVFDVFENTHQLELCFSESRKIYLTIPLSFYRKFAPSLNDIELRPL